MQCETSAWHSAITDGGYPLHACIYYNHNVTVCNTYSFLYLLGSVLFLNVVKPRSHSNIGFLPRGRGCIAFFLNSIIKRTFYSSRVGAINFNFTIQVLEWMFQFNMALVTAREKLFGNNYYQTVAIECIQHQCCCLLLFEYFG